MPTWLITGTPASAIARMTGAFSLPPCIFTTSAPPHIDRHRQSVGKAVAHHPQAVADRGDVDAGALRPHRRRVIRDRRHHHLLARLLALRKVGHGEFLAFLRHGMRSCRYLRRAPSPD